MKEYKIMKCPYCNVDMYRIKWSLRPDWQCPNCNKLFEGGTLVEQKEMK